MDSIKKMFFSIFCAFIFDAALVLTVFADSGQSAQSGFPTAYDTGKYSESRAEGITYDAYSSEDCTFMVIPYEDKILLSSPIAYTEFISGITGESIDVSVINTSSSKRVLGVGDTVAAGDTVKLVNLENGCTEYIVISDDFTINSQDFSGGEQVAIVDNEFVAGTQELCETFGMFGKDKSDRSVGISASGVPSASPHETRPMSQMNARAEILSVSWFRSKAMFFNDKNLTERSEYTYEVRISYTGEQDSVNINARPGFYSYETLSSVFGYTELLNISTNDGSANTAGNIPLNFVFRPNCWYTISFDIKPDGFYDVYVNDALAASGVNIRNTSSLNKMQFIGFNWIGYKQAFLESDNPKLRGGSVYIDDITAYYGCHKGAESCRAESDEYYIDESSDTIYTNVKNIDAFASNVDFGSNEAYIYTDSTLAEEACEILPGCVIFLKSANGRIYRYYTIAYPYSELGDIVTKVNGIEGNIIESGELSAELTVYSVPYFKNTGVLIMAVYRNGKIYDMDVDCKPIKNMTDYHVRVNVKDTAGISAKVIFADSLTSLKPYMPAENFVAISR